MKDKLTLDMQQAKKANGGFNPLDAFVMLCGDCLKLMFDIPEKSVDAVITDLPYGITSARWDSILPLDMLWYHFGNICKNNTTFIFFSSQPFTTMLINSNPKWFKYELIWNKTFGMGQNAKRMPIKAHENILIFYKNKSTYNPIMTDKKHIRPFPTSYKTELMDLSKCSRDKEHLKNNKKYPISIIELSSRVAECNPLNRVHPTQKPVELLEYLIKTYTNEDETILDITMGSGSTGVACKKLNRNFIGIEKDEKYFEIAKERISAT